jgi:bifunctional non-homologous end joining protein LigD
MLTQPIKPMLLTMQKEAFIDNRYLWEIKWDGWRIILVKEGSKIEAFTRHGNRVTDKFPELQEVAAGIKVHSAVIDCEGVCIRDGRSIFDDFQYRGRLSNDVKIQAAAKSKPATFVAFDLIHSSRDHTGESLMFRKQRLQEIINPSEVIIQTPYIDGDGLTLFQLTKEKNMEGVVAKRKGSTYQIGRRSTDWLKIKHFKLIDTIILGYRESPFQIIVGLNFRTAKNKAVATVEFGFSPEEKQVFRRIARGIHTKHDGKTQWIEPLLCCKIHYLERTELHNLRITSFKGFLFGKRPEDCVWQS